MPAVSHALFSMSNAVSPSLNSTLEDASITPFEGTKFSFPLFSCPMLLSSELHSICTVHSFTASRPDPDPEPSPDPAPEPTPDPTPDPKPTPDPEPSGTNLTNPGSDDWRTILVSAKYPLAEELDMEREFICNYAGFDLKVDARIAQPLRDFMAAAKADGYDLQLISAYRTFARSAILLENEVQAQMKYNGYSREKAEQVAATRVAPPGTSEHNTGLAVDILSGDYYYHHSTMEESFEYDAEAIWMAEHCAEYGFILRYPKGKQDVTGIIFEPWHFRYVGVEIATYIMENNLTLEEYLGAA